MRDDYDFSKAKRGVVLDSEELKKLVQLKDTREEVLRELGRQKARQELAKKMIELGEPPEKIASLTGLTLEEIQKLQ